MNRVAFSADGGLLASGSNDRSITIWETKTFTIVKQINHKSMVFSLQFSPCKVLVCGDGGGRLTLYDDHYTQIQKLTPHKDWVKTLAFSRDASFLVSGSYDNVLVLYAF